MPLGSEKIEIALRARDAGPSGPKLAAQGFSDRFRRMWDYYLAYCEAAFATGNTGVVQFTLQRR